MPKKYHYTKKTGRPTKYKPAYCRQIIAYMRRGGKRFHKPMVVDKAIVNHPLGLLPAYFEGFAGKIGVTTETLSEWCRVHPEFSDSHKKAKEIQLQRLLDGLLGQNYNPAGAIFVLKNGHGYKDRLDLNGNGLKSGDTHYHYTTINVDAKPEELVSDILAELSRRPAISAA